MHRLTLDDATEQGLYKRICQIRGVEWTQALEDEWKAKLLRATATLEDAQEEYYCVPKQGGGAYLSRAVIESRMNEELPVFRYEGTAEFNAWPEDLREAAMNDWLELYIKPELEKLDPNLQHAFGEDFGRSGDLTVISPMTITQQLKRVTPFILELRNVPFKQQEQALFYVVDRLPRFIGGALDARGNGQYLAEQAKYRYGDRIQEVMLSQSWYLENMPPFKAAFEDDEIEITKDADILTDLRAIQVIKGIPKLPDGNTSNGKQRHGDAAISLCLGYFASKQEYEEFGYESISVKQDKDITSQFHNTHFRSGQRGIL